MIVADEFIMLGKTVPDDRADGRHFVCSAGYQRDLGLIRIYPLSRHASPKRWSQTSVLLERNPKDNRKESWRLAVDRAPDQHAAANVRAFRTTGEVARNQRATLIPDCYFVDSVAQANSERRSLALLRPQSAEINWTAPDATKPLDVDQLELISMHRPDGKPDRIPRLQFRDESGPHALQLRDWGMYELIRRYGLDYAGSHAADALHLSESSTLLIGNLNAHRTTWLVISVLNLGAAQPALFADLNMAAS